MDTIKMLTILLVITSSGVLWGSTTANPKRCPPGQYLFNATADFPCQNCPVGTFMPDYNEAAECHQHRKCYVAEEIYLFEGNSTADAVCYCRPGWERIKLPDLHQYSHGCFPCSDGTVSQTVPGSDDLPGDTMCCRPEDIPMFKWAYNSRMRLCWPRNSDDPPLHQTTVQPSTANSDETKNCSKSTQDALGVLFGILLIAVIAFVGIIVYGRMRPQSLCGTCVPPFCRAKNTAGDQFKDEY